MCVFVAGRCSPSPLLSYLLIPSYYCVLYSPHFVDADTLSALTWGRIYAFDEPQQSVSSSLCVPSGDNVPLSACFVYTLEMQGAKNRHVPGNRENMDQYH